MKELDVIFSSLSRRLGIYDDTSSLPQISPPVVAMALDVAKLEVLGLLMRLQASPNTRPDSIVKVRRGGGDGNN